ncbi:hypothetical protein NB311A_02149 [Nitrobacter sp. Nb-311A]|uniref:hypothetical protein n=1 Tax=unclassified Nitrobacter TaxID=2620411 RepID=UPI0000687FA4|nr:MULTISPECIES: hypothetical protein [unclassified Nitrobacter]EAQ36268.1 hypothetical protein NB311A_02149 [Nitrobacter sp. Nb-311A]MCB1393671.1 hypothetical protein [Nitrobacter sp.]MCV0387327.1 hypothetical protein [Nitrobacter sp.]
MCDYSLHHVSSRPAKVADKLVTMELAKSNVRGFAAVGELGPKLVIHDSPPELAVCLLPGTELAFDENVRYEQPRSFLGIKFSGKARVDHKVASFRKVDVDNPYVQHDALEFPNGQVVKIAQLVAGQTATVLQLPVNAQQDEHEHEHAGRRRARDSRLALNRSSKQGMFVPSQGAVMLWDSVCGRAVDLSSALTESFQRLTAPKQPSILEGEMAGGLGAEVSFENGVPTVTSTAASQKPEKKISAGSAV